MDELVFVAVDPAGTRREWRLEEKEYLVGRADGQERPGWLPVEGDPRLSRSHFRIRPQGRRLHVSRCDQARNPLFFRGSQSEGFELEPGEMFFAGKCQFGAVLRSPPSHYTLVGQAREKARLRRLEDCFAAVLEMLARLKEEAGEGAPWRQAFPVLRRLLPDVRKLLFLEVHGATCDILEEETWGEHSWQLDSSLLRRAFEQSSTVTQVSEETAEPQEGTMLAGSSWASVSPIRGMEGSCYALCAFGSGPLAGEALEEVAALVDIVAELVGHHLVVEQAAQYSNLLAVFGHHVGTLFKTSGVLKLWGNPATSPDVRLALERLMPIWGISQAISLHKKQGEQEGEDLLEGWVDPAWRDRPDLAMEIGESLRRMVRYVHWGGQGEAPFLPWLLEGERLDMEPAAFPGLPPLADNPVLWDKTLALTVGLMEMLHNVRKYPEPRGAGHEDRRELEALEPEQRRVEVTVRIGETEAVVEVLQPVVTRGDGSIPQSRSLERIRSLESRLLRALVETSPAREWKATPLSHIVQSRQRWIFRWGRLLGKGGHLGQETAPLTGG